MKRGILFLTASLLFLLAPNLVLASSGRDVACEAAYEKQLAAIDPMLVPTFKAATVAMDKNFGLEAWETEKGYVLSCQSRPTSEHVTVSFDER